MVQEEKLLKIFSSLLQFFPHPTHPSRFLGINFIPLKPPVCILIIPDIGLEGGFAQFSQIFAPHPSPISTHALKNWRGSVHLCVYSYWNAFLIFFLHLPLISSWSCFFHATAISMSCSIHPLSSFSLPPSFFSPLYPSPLRSLFLHYIKRTWQPSNRFVYLFFFCCLFPSKMSQLIKLM